MIRSHYSACVAAALLATACSGKAQQQVHEPGADSTAAGVVTFAPESPMLKQIAREAVRLEPLPSDEVVAAGKVEANPNRVSRVVLPVTGRIVTVLVRLGDAVRRGQPLFTMQSPDADAAISNYLSVQAAQTQAQAALGKAQSDYDRATDLFAHNAVARKEVLAAEGALTQAKAAREQSDAACEQAKRRVSVLGLRAGDFQQEVVVTAPLSGKVLDLSLVPGEYRTDQTTPVVTIADLSSVWVTSQVPESYIRFVQTGERVEINLVAYPGETFDGRVARIADVVDPQTRSVKVQAEMANPKGRFRPEMYGSIHHIESTVRMAVIPAAAVVHSGDRTLVFVERSPGQFEERIVTVGKPAGSVIRVLSGVAPGDSIVVDGVMLLQSLVKPS
jgi:cobalt-zinc-cadmium efflux system membrane fusion protein